MGTRFRKVRASTPIVALLLALLFLTANVSADSLNIDFESYAVGNINGQDGWIKTGSFDAAIVNQSSLSLSYPSFGNRSFRISNAVTTGSFGDQTFSKPLANEAGETAAQNGGMSGGTRQPYYETSFDFASADPAAEQVGLMVGISPDRGDGARMSLFRLYDKPAGLAVEFYDFDKDRPGDCVDGLDFQGTMVSTGLARNAVHNVRVTMQFVDGVDNDVVKVYVNGNLVHTGQSWEDYFVDCEGSATRTVDSLLFRASGTAQPTLSGKGFLVDNMTQYSGPVPCTTVCYADVVSGDDANGGASPADAKKTIQAAVNQVSVGGTVIAAAGTYPENVTVNKKLTLDGAGSGSNPSTATIIDPVTGRGLMIAGSGASAADRLIIKDLRVTGATNDDGITLEPPNGGSYLTLDNVASVGHTGTSADGLEVKHFQLITDVKILNSNLSNNGLSGFRLGTATQLDGLLVENTIFDGSQYGVLVFTVINSPPPTFDHITFTDVAITNNTQKGLYAERMNNATFTDLTVTGNGSAAAAFMAGFDINLKYGAFNNIAITDSTFGNNGLGDTANAGVDLTVKARNDASYASMPATLTNLTINKVIFNGATDVPLSLGNNLDEATTAATQNAFIGTSGIGAVVFGTAPAAMLNLTCNWWNAASGPAGVGPGSGAAVSPNADYTPWLFTNDLDGACVTGATIKVSKVTDPNTDTTTVFTFDPSWSATNFTLKNGESLTSAPLPPATYSVVEVSMPALWAQQSATCDNLATGPVETEDPSSLTVAAGDTWECTFTNEQLELCSAVCYADAVNGNDADDGQTPGTAFKTIQKAIDTVAVNGTVRVLPGDYSETASNRLVLGSGSPYVFGLFIAKDITVQGVTAGDVPITDPAATLAYVETNSTADFGPSGIFVEGDGVTIAGLEIGLNVPGQNKTIEIIGDAFTLKDSFVNDPIGSVYFNDWQFDTGSDTSHVQSYTVDHNIFASGVSVDLGSGAGYSGPVSGRQITDNIFEMSPGETWPVISFNGSGTGVEWFIQSVGGAIITGNTFNNNSYGAVQWIRARGDYDNSQFDWASYWNDNTYDNAVVFGSNPPSVVGEWSYTSGSYTFNHVRRIGAVIQEEVNHAPANAIVLVNDGIYPENVTIDKSLTLRGSGQSDDANGTVIDGSTLTGYGIYVNANVQNVTIERLRVEDFAANPSSGIWANGQNNGFIVEDVTVDNNGFAGNSGGGVYMNGPVDNVLITGVTASGNRTRGIVIWNGFKTDITITDNTVTGNVCCGIELQDGTASGVTVTGNTVSGNADSGMAFTGLTSGAGPNLIANNTLTNNGRFGMEIKLPNGTGLATGDGSIVIEDNTVTLSTPSADLRDFAGIAAFRRGWVAGNNNVDIPTGVIIRDNTVTGYAQNNAGSNSEGFGIVVEGTNMTVTGNTLNNNEVGAQVQGGHTPYTANTNQDGDQTNLADQFFGRGNSPVGCALFGSNTFTGNTADTRKVGTGGTIVAKNVDTGEQFCSIQAAIDDADTINGHTIEVFAGVHTENVLVNKSVTLKGANAGISPNDSGDPLTANPARVAETEMAVTGSGNAFRVAAANVTIDGFKFTDANVAQADVQSPIIGAGGNFGGDAPGVKIVNNLFFETNRNLVYFNGPTMMQGGTVDDNRVQNPDRPDTGCAAMPTAPSNCGHQLFNLWQTNNLSFQDNVTIAAPAGGDRIRTLNINASTNVTLAGNTVRYTCTYTCFAITGTANDVTVTDNDLVTDVGNVIQLHASWATGNVNVHHNVLTTGADFPIVVDNTTADLDNVHINRNAVTGGMHARNGTDNLVTPGTETLDVTCNWWGSAAGPTPANFFGPNNFTPWLFSSNLDSACALGGTITVVKQTTPDGDPAVFEFDPSWGANFTLSDGQSNTSAPLPPATYSVAEVNLASPWTLANASCSNGATTAPPSAIPMAAGETWTCTFENSRPICTTVCYVDAVNGNDAANGGTGTGDAFKTIQKAIDTVNVGGEIRVLPGTYDQDEKNGVDPTTGGAGANDLNIFVHKANITIQGVTAGDVDITTAAGAQAFIKPKRAVPTFGVSTMFVQADGVTIQGVKFFAQNGAVQAAKTVEVIGNDVTFDGVAFDVSSSAVGVYIGDFSYDATNDVSTIADYLITNSAFTSTDQTGMAFQAANGAGWPDNVGTRAITNNTFVNLDDALTFAGAGSAGWRLYPVGTADITGNTFSQIKRRHVMAWGNYPISNPTALGYADPDWCGIIANNTFDKGSMLWVGTTQCPSGQPRRWDAASGNAAPYDWFRNVAGIYSAIQQYGVNKAVSGDLLHVFPGTYVEQVMVNKTMTLLGSGPAQTFIKPPATIPVASDPNSGIVRITGAGVSVEMSQFTVSGPGPSGCGSIGYGIAVRDGAHANIHDNAIVDIKDTGNSGCQNGNAIIVGRMAWSTTGTADITNNVISGYQKTGILVDNAGSSANITGNTISGDGPIAYIAENGIQVSRGATAEIETNTITGHSYSPFTATSAGILLYQAGAVNSDGNTVTDNQIGINIIDSSGTHQNNVISATATGTGSAGFWGMVVDAPPPGRVPSPADGEASAPPANGPAPQVPAQTVVVTGNTFTSDNSAGGVGLEADAGYGAKDIDLTATKNLIHNWETGVVVYECTGGGCAASTFTNVKINRNSIAGNTDGLFADTVDAAETDATCNWWGNASGPSDAGPGTGDTVSTEVDFTPWLYSNDLDSPCFVGGTISIDKVAPGGGATAFEFDVSWSGTNVTLTDGDAPYVSALLPADDYSVSEVNLPSPWVQLSATCDNNATPATETADPSAITLADGDEWKCTFTNKNRPLCTTICYADIVNGSDSANGGTSPTDAFKTIQMAIDTVTPGGEVRVLPGTYPESPTVHKSVTMVGVNGRDVTFIALQTNTNYTHSLLISGADVTMDGFTVIGIDAACPTLAATNIYVNPSADNVLLKNNRIQVGAIDGSCSTGDDGFGLITEYTAQPDVATLTVEDTIFEPLTAAGGQRAFYINPSVVSFVFRGNEITGKFNGTALSQAQNSLIENNTVTGTGASAGIGVWGEPDPTVWGHATIQGNTITGTANAISIYEAQNVTVTKNILNANGRGVRVMTVTPLVFDKTTIHINRNAITNNTTEGITNLLTEAGDIDGTCNWWNSASGPGAVASGSGDKVSAQVDYTPWLFSNDLDGPCFVGGTISIDKVATGGGALEFEFDLSWSANNVKLTDAGAPYVSAPLPAGPYSITEVNLPAGWALDSATCDNTVTTPVETVNPSAITVADGDAWVCKFTNKPLGTIQIAKVASGGGTTVFEFDVSWSTTNVTLTDGQSTTPVALAAGQYTIDEVNVPAGWTLSSATCVNQTIQAPLPNTPVVNDAVINVANGDTWVCTFTNVKLGTIQIAKVAPGAGALVFTFDVTWSGTDVTLTDGQSTTPVPLVAGNYGITEVNVPPGWASVSATCDNAITPAAETVDPASITVANGDAWICTFTNSLLGTVRIAKVATGGGATTFEFDLSWSGTNVTLADGQSTTAEPLAAGTYSVTEINIPAGWVAQGATCDNGSTPTVETVNPTSIPVANGDAWVCTFTNVKQGTIQIAKIATGGGTTTFEFDVSWSPTNVTLQHGQSSTPVSQVPGTYTITEVNIPAGWVQQSATCDNSSTPTVETVNPSSIPLANGDAWVCTFTNAKQGTVKIAKSAPGGGTTTFEFDVSWSATNVTLQNGQSTTPVALVAGTYAITEVNLPQYWMLSSAACVNGAETAPVSAIPVENGDAWVCTFNNVYAPSSTCAVGAANTQWTDLLGIGMGSTTKHKASAKIVIPNATNLVDLYGQLVAKSTGLAKYVRFIMPGKNNYVEVNAITAPADHAAGNFWYGSDLPTAGTSYVTGKWFLQKSGTKNHIPRAFVLYPTYNDPAHTYVNVWDTYLPSEGEVDWNVAAGWTPRRTIVVPIAAPLGPETFHIELALADNDKDARPVWVTVTAGGVTQTVQPTNPDKGDQLNLLVFDLANVPAGTNEIVIEVYSPSVAIDGIQGDSASLVGMTANYQCSPLSQP